MVNTSSRLRVRQLSRYIGKVVDGFLFNAQTVSGIPVQVSSDGTTFSLSNSSIITASPYQTLFLHDFEDLSGLTVYNVGTLACPFPGSGGNFSLTFYNGGSIVLPPIDVSEGAILLFKVTWCATDRSWSGSILVKISDGFSDFKQIYDYYNPQSESSMGRWSLIKVAIPKQYSFKAALIQLQFTGFDGGRAAIDMLRVISFGAVGKNPTLAMPFSGSYDLVLYEGFENTVPQLVTFTAYSSSYSNCPRSGKYAAVFSPQGVIRTVPVYIPFGGVVSFYITWCSTSNSFSGTCK